MNIDKDKASKFSKGKCPIRAFYLKGKTFGVGREVTCINCAVKVCWDDQPNTRTLVRVKLFLDDLIEVIQELEEIRDAVLGEVE